MLRTNTYKLAKAFAAVTILVTCFSAAQSQAQVLPALQNSFNTFQKTGLHEKLFVHTNKSFFLAGEIIWFKIYDADGSNNNILNFSKVAYVEVLDNNHSALVQAKVELKNGTGSGSLFIPFSAHNGNYQFRAYTNWMKNFDPGYFFEKQVVIINPLKTPSVESKPTTPGYDVQFFPEGGHLVSGLSSKVAFKLTGADGRGVDCSGAVINQQNDTVAHFSSLKFGIGSFMLTPISRAVYKAIVKVNNTTITKELPPVSDNGYIMQATDKGDSYEVSVQSTGSKPAAGIYLIAHTRHSVSEAESGSLVNSSTHFSINKNKLEAGISYITLFDDQQRPLCERMVFKRPDKRLNIKADIDSRAYGTRKKVSINLSAVDKGSKPLAAKMSVSVFKIDSLQKEDANHIYGYMWLRSYIKGNIEDPGYYLENNSEEANQALDNLLLSQGWTQYDWGKVLTGAVPHFKYLPEFTGPIISGRMVNNTTSKPAAGIFAFLSLPGTQSLLYTAKSDTEGQLLFNVKNFYGLKEIVVQNNTTQDSTYHIDIANPFIEQFSAVTIPQLNINPAVRKALAGNSLNMQVQNIFSANSFKKFYEPVVDSVPFYGTPTKSYLLDDFTRFTTMEEVLREYVVSILVNKSGSNWSIRIIRNKQTLPDKPLAMLDGRPVFDINKVFALDPLKIKKLDMVQENYLYGPEIFNGIVSFTSYKGDGSAMELDPKAVVLDYEGLQLERKFYSPAYETDQQLNSTIPDFRNALYWNPDADTGADGKSSASFYTGDKPGKYIGVIEGMTQDGNVGSQHFFFEVRK